MSAFDQLRAPQQPADPDRRFVERLRADVAGALRAAAAPTVELAPRARPADTPATSATTRGDDMTATITSTDITSTDLTSADAIGLATIVPYLSVRDAAAAIDWYVAVLGAVETVRYTGDDGRVGHAELQIGGATLYVSDEYLDYGAASPEHLGGTAVALNLVVADVDTVFAAAAAAGATVQREPADQAYGERSCAVVDPWGHRWMIQTTIATPTVAEIDAAMDGFTVTASGAVADATVGARIIRGPRLDDRSEVHLLGIRDEVPMADLGDVIPRLLDEVTAWLEHHSVAARKPLVRYHAIDPERRTVDITIGFAAEPGAHPGDGRVVPESLLAGRYASLVYAGLEGEAANAVLIGWADANDVRWDRWDGDHGDTFAARVEYLLTGPDDDPDPAAWLTEVAILISDDGGAR